MASLSISMETVLVETLALLMRDFHTGKMGADANALSNDCKETVCPSKSTERDPVAVRETEGGIGNISLMASYFVLVASRLCFAAQRKSESRRCGNCCSISLFQALSVKSCTCCRSTESNQDP